MRPVFLSSPLHFLSGLLLKPEENGSNSQQVVLDPRGAYDHLALSSCFSLMKHPPSFAYRLHRVQELGELIEAPWAGCGIFSLASNDTIKFLDVVHSKFIKEFLIFQPIHWNWCGVKTEWGRGSMPTKEIRQSIKFSDHKLDPHPHREGTIYSVSCHLKSVCLGPSACQEVLDKRLTGHNLKGME